MIFTMTPEKRAKHEAAIRAATETYRHATRALAEAQYELVAAMQSAYAHGRGLRVADIVRAADHEWTREYVGKKVNPEGRRE